MVCINENAKGIALVVGKDRQMLYTITDGDLRRAILTGQSLEMKIEAWAKQRTESGGNVRPTTAPFGTPTSELLRLMQGGLRHIPLVDEEGCVADLAFLEDIVAEPALAMNAVVMAGGYGTRLHPLTVDLPKPMLPVGNRPVIEHIVNQLRDVGVSRVSITTHYKPESIMRHFGNGQKFGINIEYVNEDNPLGTAGALGLISNWHSTLLVINGDVLTGINYRSMLAFHAENKAIMTVAVRQYDLRVPYGVVETQGVQIRRLSEKPTLWFFVNAGVYLLEPAIYKYFVPSQKLDMTDLISTLVADDQKVVSFPVSEYWIDVGQHADYLKAQTDFAHDESL